MKKTLVILLCMVLAVCLVACGTKPEDADSSAGDETEKNAIAQLIDDGYERVLSVTDESSWSGIYQKGDSYIEATAVLTEAEKEQYETIDIFAEDYDEKEMAFLRALSDVQIQDISGLIPSQAELDTYVGKTIADLVAEGYERIGSIDDGSGAYVFQYDNGTLELYVGVTDGSAIEDLDSCEEDEILALTISSVTFSCISAGYFDE